MKEITTTNIAVAIDNLMRSYVRDEIERIYLFARTLEVLLNKIPKRQGRVAACKSACERNGWSYSKLQKVIKVCAAVKSENAMKCRNLRELYALAKPEQSKPKVRVLLGRPKDSATKVAEKLIVLLEGGAVIAPKVSAKLKRILITR